MLANTMSDGSESPPQRDADRVGDALRAAIERTLDATATSAWSTRERAGGLVDEVVKLGRGARDELARRGPEAREGITRRGQEAAGGLARRGQDASGEVAKRLELLERRLTELEARLGGGDAATDREASEPKSKPEG
jgi:hypothetical protein